MYVPHSLDAFDEYAPICNSFLEIKLNYVTNNFSQKNAMQIF